MRTRMHAGEVFTDAVLVRRLLAGQFPEWSRMRIESVPSYGTDHDVYRVGDRLSARLPRIGWATGQATKEAEWLPRLAPHLPLALPVPVVTGAPAEGYPFAWSIYAWLPGASIEHAHLDLDRAADDLAAFVSAMRRIPTGGAPERPPGARGGALAEGDAIVRDALARLGDRVDGRAALRAWDESLAAPGWERDAWIHGDLLPGNLIAHDGRLTAVIDFGGLNVGDPACDLQPAWSVFTGTSRACFRAALQADEASWLRGRGWSLRQAVVALPYYWDTNPGMVRVASRALAEVLGDADR